MVGGKGGVKKEVKKRTRFAKFLFLGRRGTKERLENKCACANPEAGYEMIEHGMGKQATGWVCLPLLTKYTNK